MKNIILLNLSVFILINACTSIIVVIKDKDVLEDLNNQLEGQKATILLNNNTTKIVMEIQISSDSVSWTEAESQDYYYNRVLNKLFRII